MSTSFRNKYVVAVTAVAGVLHLGTGAWAFFAPRSFYDILAAFPPYHTHFLHDIGAFLLGIGVALLAALVWRDAVFVALTGGTVAAGFHAAAHITDRHLGGLASDPWLLSAFALLLVGALVLRAPARHGGTTPADREMAGSGEKGGAR